MSEDAAVPPRDAPDSRAEIARLEGEAARLSKIIRVLMDRAERSTSVQTSDYGLFQTTVLLEEKVRRRTAELQAALRENKRMNRELRARAASERRVLRESEERLRALLHNSSDMITVVDRDGCVLYQAGAVGAVLGQSPEALEGTSLASWVRDEDLPRLAALCRATETAAAELHLRHADGRLRTCEVRATRLNDHPTWEGVVLNIRDVTDRQQLEHELRLAQKLESIGQLAAGIAHEINTPVQFVNNSVQFLDRAFADIDRLQRTYAELRDAAHAGHVTPELMDRVADAEDTADVEYLRERVPQAIERSFHGLERVAKIVGAMRSFAHPPTTDREPVDLCDVVKKSLVVSANEYKYVADLTVELAELPRVHANTGDLNQIVLNLIVNASHAIADVVGESGARGAITIRTRVHDGHAEIEIADTGGGIPPDIAERVFDPFFTTKEIGRGTGQGLTIARTLVERHHGQISFDSRPGEGTTFTVALPIATSNEQTRGLAA